MHTPSRAADAALPSVLAVIAVQEMQRIVQRSEEAHGRTAPTEAVLICDFTARPADTTGGVRTRRAVLQVAHIVVAGVTTSGITRISRGKVIAIHTRIATDDM